MQLVLWTGCLRLPHGVRFPLVTSLIPFTYSLKRYLLKRIVFGILLIVAVAYPTINQSALRALPSYCAYLPLVDNEDDLPCYRGGDSPSSPKGCAVANQMGEMCSIYKGGIPSDHLSPAGCSQKVVLSSDGKVYGGIYKGDASAADMVSCAVPAILTPDESLVGLYKGSISTMPGVSCLDAPALLNYIYPVYQGGRSFLSISCGDPYAMGTGVDVFRGGASTIAALGCSSAESSLTDGASLFKGGRSKPAASACLAVSSDDPSAPSLYRGGGSSANRLDCSDASSFLGDVLGCYNGGASKPNALACFTDPCIELKPASITPSGAVPICKGKSLTLKGSEAFKYQWMAAVSPSGEWKAVASSQNIEVKESGYFKLITFGREGCSKESKVFYAEFNDGIAKPSVDVGGSTTICLNGSVPLSSSKAFRYRWSNGASSQVVEADKAGVYQVTIEDENGCVAVSDPVEIKQAHLPSPSSIITPEGPTEFCKGGSVRLTSVDAAYYRWSNGAVSKSVDATESGAFSVRIGDANGCEATSAPVRVNVHSIEPKLSASSSMICYGKAVELSVLPAGKRVDWFRDGVPMDNGDASISVDKPGEYLAVVTDEFGCSFSSDKLTVSSNGTVDPLARITPSRSLLCKGGSLTLSAPEAVGYEWSTLDSKKDIVVFAPGDYSVTVVDAFGCPSSASISIKEVPVSIKPVIVPSRSTSLCPGEAIDLKVSEGVSFEWNNGQTTSSIRISDAGSYWAKVFDGNGCDIQTPSVDVAVFDEKKPVIEPMGKTTLCAGDLLELRTIGAKAYKWSTGETAPSVFVDRGGAYMVTIIDENGCSFDSPYINVSKVDGPIPPAVVSSSVPVVEGKVFLCPGDRVVLEANEAASYLWSNGATERSIVVDRPGKFSVALTYPSSCGASSQEIEVVVRSRKPIISVSGRSDICPGEKVALEVDHGKAFSWNSGQNFQTIEIDHGGEFFATVVDEYGCTLVTDPITISEFKVTPPSITVDGKSRLCVGESAVLRSSSALDYQWSTGEVSQDITVKDAGAYSVTVTDANGCKATSEIIAIDKHPLRNPVIEAKGSLTLCQGDELTLNAPVDGASYLWSNGASSQNIVVKENDKFGSFRYSVAVTYPEGCTYSSPEVFVKVNRNPNKPDIFSIGSNDICPDPSIALIATQSDGYRYEWSNGASTFGIVATKPGNYWVRVFDKMTGCRSKSDDIVVDKLISAKVKVAPDGPIDICDVGSVQLSSSIQNALEYRWSSGEKTPSILVNQPGYYRVTVTNEKGCTQTSDYVEVRSGAQIPEPSISVDGATSFCQGQSVRLSCTLSKNYQWRRNGVDIATANLRSLVVSDAGSYTVVVSDKSGCKKESRPVVIKVNPLPKVTIMPSGKVPLCAGAKLMLTASNAISYEWSNGTTNQQIEVISPNQTFSVSVVDANGCRAESEKVEVVEATDRAPAPSVEAKPICQGSVADVVASSSISNPTFTWYSSANATMPMATGSVFKTEQLLANTALWVSVRNATLCESDRVKVDVVVKPRPSIVFDLPSSACASSKSIKLVATPAGGSFSGAGVKGDVLDLSSAAGDVEVTYSVEDGCEASMSKRIHVDSFSVTLKSDATGVIEPGSLVIFSAAPSSDDGNTYEFYINDKLIQSGVLSSFKTDELNNGDKVRVKALRNATGCFAEDYVEANVKQPISWEEPSGNVACASGLTVFKVTNYAGYSYRWRLSDAAAGGFAATANPNEVSVSWNDNKFFSKGVIMVEVDVIVDYWLIEGKVSSLSRRIKLYRRPETGAVWGIRSKN